MLVHSILYCLLVHSLLVHTVSWLQCVISVLVRQSWSSPISTVVLLLISPPSAILCWTQQTLSLHCSPHQSPFGVENSLEPLSIRGKKHCKARTKAGSLAQARYYFSWTVPLSMDCGRLTAWGRGWRVTERRGMMYCEDIALLRTLPLSILRPPALIIQRVLCPPFQCWTHGSHTLKHVQRKGLCYVTVPSLTGAPLS